MVVLVAGVERFVSRHEVEFSSPENLDWRGVGRAAREQTRGRDLLILGTSMVQQGLLPSTVGEPTGGRG